MHSCDVIAYCADGKIYCNECGKPEPCDWDSDPPSPIFAENEHDAYGATCGACRNCYVIDAGWYSHGDATNPAFTRWATCRECNAQYPFSTGHGFTRARHDALCGRLYCYSCGKHSLHF